MWEMILASALIVFLYVTFVFFLAQVKQDNSIMDIAWGLGFVILVFFNLVSSGTLYPRQVLVAILVLIWGLRLSLHIYFRKRGRGEDFRYRKWREDWGGSFLVRSYIQIFLLQGLLMVIVSLPIFTINTFPDVNLTFLDNTGLVLWCLGFVTEVFSDYQLVSFVRNDGNKGKILASGFWKYSRHPNYFGESTMWWGIFLIALSSRYGAFSIISPILMTLLLVFVSGVPLLEKRYKDHEEYQKYAERTPIFFPWLPKKDN